MGSRKVCLTMESACRMVSISAYDRRIACHATSSGSYTQFAIDGRQTMVGAAQVYKEIWLRPSDFDVSVSASITACTMGISGSFPVLNFAGCGLLPAYTMFRAPLDAASTGSVLVTVCWSASTDGDAAVFRVGYDYQSADRPILSSSYSGSYVLAASNTSASEMTSSSICSIPSFTAGNVVLFRLEHDGTSASDDSGSTTDVWGVSLKYVSNSLGSQVT